MHARSAGVDTNEPSTRRPCAPPFRDPREDPAPPYRGELRLPANDHTEVADLVSAIKAGRIYDVERWIRAGRPLQFEYPDRGHQWLSPMQAAIRYHQHDAALLLLCHGYRSELELRPPLEEALKSRKLDIANLLLDWGADPAGASICQVLDSYDRPLLERLRCAGYDFTQEHELAGYLCGGSHKPLFGFVKRFAPEDPALRSELNLALVMAVEANSEKGVAMCLWAGADPRAPVPFADDESSASDEDEEPRHRTAVRTAVVWVLNETRCARSRAARSAGDAVAASSSSGRRT